MLQTRHSYAYLCEPSEYVFWNIINHNRFVVIHLSGDGRFPDHQHADSIAQLFPGASAVLLSNRGSRDPAAGAPNPSQSHRQTRQHTQVLQHKVCVCACLCVYILWRCTSMTVYVNCRIVFLCSIISDISVLKLKVDKCSRQDNLFMKKVSKF